MCTPLSSARDAIRLNSAVHVTIAQDGDAAIVQAPTWPTGNTMFMHNKTLGAETLRRWSPR